MFGLGKFGFGLGAGSGSSEAPVSQPPTFVALGTTGNSTLAITPGLPAGLADNDIMLLPIQTTSQAITIVSPSGWVQVADSPQDAAGTRLTVFWKRAAPGETAPTTSDSGDHQVGVVFAFRGCVASGNPWDVTAGDTAVSGTAVSVPGDTTTVPNCLVVVIAAHATDAPTPNDQFSGWANADLTSITERFDASTSVGSGGGFALVTGIKAAAGAYAATTATLGTASVQSRMSIALRPA